MKFIKTYDSFLNEKKHVELKRKYGERPTMKIFDDAPARQRILNYVNKQPDGVISKHALSEYLKMRNEVEGSTTSFSWVSKNSKYLKKFEQAGTIYYKLTPLAKRAIERTTINEDDDEIVESCGICGEQQCICESDEEYNNKEEDDDEEEEGDDDEESEETVNVNINIKEAKKTQVKRKYGDYESISIGENGPIRDKILKYINERGNTIGKNELSSYIQRWLNPMNKRNEDVNMKGTTTINWVRKNTKYLKEFQKDGKIFYRLTPLAKRVISRKPLNEND